MVVLFGRHEDLTEWTILDAGWEIICGVSYAWRATLNEVVFQEKKKEREKEREKRRKSEEKKREKE